MIVAHTYFLHLITNVAQCLNLIQRKPGEIQRDWILLSHCTYKQGKQDKKKELAMKYHHSVNCRFGMHSGYDLNRKDFELETPFVSGVVTIKYERN
jgi:hypothetical protein